MSPIFQLMSLIKYLIQSTFNYSGDRRIENHACMEVLAATYSGLFFLTMKYIVIQSIKGRKVR